MMNKAVKGQEWTDKPKNFFNLALNFTRYILTKEDLIIRKGLLHMTETYIKMYRITDKKLSINIVQRMLGLGSIVIFAKDEDTKEIVLKNISNPRDVLEQLNDIEKAVKMEYGVHGREMTGALD